MSDMFEFGFEESKVIKTNAVEQFKQTRSGEKTRVSIISLKKYSDGILAEKAKEKGSPLTDMEKAEYIAKIDKKIAEQLNKSVDDLTEVDRLNIKSPRFAFSYTHYNEAVGTIRCLSKYEGNTVVRPEICCNKFGDAGQTVGMVVMTYPVKDGLEVDMDLLTARKYVNFYIWKMSAQKFKKVEDAYREARGDDKFTIDLNVVLDGDPKFQKQQISAGSSAVWTRLPANSETRAWILDQGLRMWKHVSSQLGFEMKADKISEKLGLSSGGHGGAAGADMPKLVSSYDDLI